VGTKSRVALPRRGRDFPLLEVLGDRVVLRRVHAGVMGERRRRGHGDEQDGGERARGDHRRTMRVAVRAASHSSATIVAPPNGIHTRYSAMALLPSTPYAGMSTLQIK